jgi:flagellin-specific chaperone FliS
MNRRLFQANAKCDPQIIREVIAMAEELNQSWKAIAG